MLCGYTTELEEGQTCNAVRCPYCGRRLHSSRGIAQQNGGRGPGRREDEEKVVWPDQDGWWPEPLPKPLPPGTKKCRCPYCNYEVVVEEGTRCLNTACPGCGRGMVEGGK